MIELEPELDAAIRDMVMVPQSPVDLRLWESASRWLQLNDPIHLVSSDDHRDFWIVSRHADIVAVERDPSGWVNGQAPLLQPRASQEALEHHGIKLHTLIHMDGDEHASYRRLLAPRFNSAHIKTLTARVGRTVDDILLSLRSAPEEIDLVRTVARRLSIKVLCYVLGVPLADEDRIEHFTSTLFHVDFGQRVVAESGEVLDTFLDFVDYFDSLIASRRREPADDLVSLIAHAEIDGKRISNRHAFGLFAIVLNAGHDPAAYAIAGGLDVLLDHPDQFRRLGPEPALLTGAVNEVLRWTTPVRFFMRTASRSMVLGDRQFDEGDWILLSYLSANRDPNEFARPNSFEIYRDDVARHLAFGIGTHHCLGANLARLEIAAVLERVAPVANQIRRVGPTRFSGGGYVGGAVALPSTNPWRSV